MILLLKIAKRNGGRRIARKLRDWYPGAIYHIMHRGVRRKPIFEDEMDHQVLLQIIKTSLSKYNCWLHAYCLMTNHVHLLLETGDIDEYSCAVGSSAIIRFGSFSMIRYMIYELLSELQPDGYLVLGDTNSCLSAISAKRLHMDCSFPQVSLRRI